MIEEDEAQYVDDREPETVVPSRISARELVEPVALDVELIERGKWRAIVTDALYHDVCSALFVEGFRISCIEVLGGNLFEIEITENYTVEDAERYLDDYGLDGGGT